MDITLYDVIRGPIMTEKAYELNEKYKKLVIRVHPHANKPQIKAALEKLFDVKVDKVHIQVRKPKNVTFKRISGQKSLEKKAIITLKEGYSIELFDQARQAAAGKTTETAESAT